MTTNVFERLAKSKFRSRFTLTDKDVSYINAKGMEIIESHAIDFVRDRIAPEVIKNDGKQTPMKNHPVFVAQHATATCCRSCIAKWHKIPEGIQMTSEQQKKIVTIIMLWIHSQYKENKQLRLSFD